MAETSRETAKDVDMTKGNKHEPTVKADASKKSAHEGHGHLEPPNPNS